jgi:hypothetical protein
MKNPFRWLYDALAGPPRVNYGHGAGAAEAQAAINEELRTAASDQAEMGRTHSAETYGRVAPLGDMRGAGGGYGQPRPDIAALQNAQDQAAKADDAADES